MAAPGELLHQLLRPLKSRVPQDHRQADHVVAVRAVGGENLGRRLAAPTPVGDACRRKRRLHAPHVPPSPCGERIQADFPQNPLGELAGLLPALARPARSTANSGRGGRRRRRPKSGWW